MFVFSGVGVVAIGVADAVFGLRGRPGIIPRTLRTTIRE
jgi:hypothetical protein